MGAAVGNRGVVTSRTFTTIDAARLALDRESAELTPRRDRVLTGAAKLWCRHLEFPTVRELGAEMGHTSPSTPLNGFGRVIDIQASVIRLEWQRIDAGWISSPTGDAVGWLIRHARTLAAIDPACLRLPGLVCAAVLAADADRPRPRPECLVPLHALAAFVDAPSCPPGPAALARLVLPPEQAPPDGVELAVIA